MSLDVQPRRFSVEDYARMGEAGIFGPHERVELIEGEIIVMSPHNRRHGSRVARLTTLLVRAFGDSHEVRVQLPLTLGSASEPEPDFAVVSLADADSAPRHPQTADLVVEVADATLGFDRTCKAGLYARHGIPDYWLLNLQDDRLEIRRSPRELAQDWDYASLTLLGPGQSVTPLRFPQISFEVSLLLGL